jgi:hypothetical protein
LSQDREERQRVQAGSKKKEKRKKKKERRKKKRHIRRARPGHILDPH